MFLLNTAENIYEAIELMMRLEDYVPDKSLLNHFWTTYGAMKTMGWGFKYWFDDQAPSPTDADIPF